MIIKSLPLIVIGIVTIIVIYKLLHYFSERRFQRFINKVGTRKQVTGKLTAIQLTFSPVALANEIQKVSPKPYRRNDYLKRFFIGFMFGLFITYVLYRSPILSILGAVIIAFLFPYFDLIKKQKAYRDQIKAKLIHYFKLFSSYMRSTNYNLSRSLEFCVDGVEEPLKGDLEKVLFDLKQGASGKKAFQYLNKKYPYQGVELFHHLALLIAEQGGDDHDSLKEAAHRFSEKRYWQNKLDQNNKKLTRDRNGVLGASFAIYLMMMFMTSEYYIKFVESYVGIITITLSLISLGITINSQRELIAIDPTEVKR